MQRLQIEYGYNTRIGANFFMNYDGIILDCGPVTIGDNVMMGPRVQLLTALHPIEDHEAQDRRLGDHRADRHRRPGVVRRRRDRLPRRHHRQQHGGRRRQCRDA